MSDNIGALHRRLEQEAAPYRAMGHSEEEISAAMALILLHRQATSQQNTNQINNSDNPSSANHIVNGPSTEGTVALNNQNDCRQITEPNAQNPSNPADKENTAEQHIAHNINIWLRTLKDIRYWRLENRLRVMERQRQQRRELLSKSRDVIENYLKNLR